MGTYYRDGARSENHGSWRLARGGVQLARLAGAMGSLAAPDPLPGALAGEGLRQ